MSDRATRALDVYDSTNERCFVAAADYIDPEALHHLTSADMDLECCETNNVAEIDPDDPATCRRINFARLAIDLARRQLDNRPEVAPYRRSRAYRLDSMVSDGLISQSEADTLHRIFEG